MNRYLRVVVVVLGASALAGCVVGLPAWAPTPVPMRVLISQGIPADTLIEYENNTWFGQCDAEIRIAADGSAVYQCDYGPSEPDVRLAGRLSVNEVKRVLLAFDEAGFFTLVGGCLYDAAHPPNPPVREFWMDTDRGYVAITIGGLSKRVEYGECRYHDDNGASNNLQRLIGVIGDAVKDLPAAPPTATPEPPPEATPTSAA